MTIPVVFGQIEVAVADALSVRLSARGITVPAVNAVPRTNRPARYVLVTRPGGDEHNIVTDGPRLVTEVVAESGTAAGELASVVRALLGSLAPGHVGSIWLDRVKTAGYAFSPDPDTNAPRYLITTELWQRGNALT